MFLWSQQSFCINNWDLYEGILLLPFHGRRSCEWRSKDVELKKRRRLWRELGPWPPPLQFSAINWFLRNSWERGWRSVLCFLSSLLIPHSSGQRESCLHIHSPCGNGAIPPPALFRPLSTRSCRAWLILCLVMVGRLQSLFFFQSPLLARLQSYRDTGTWEGGRENEVHREQSLRGVHLSFFMCHSWGDLRERPRWLETQSLKIRWWWFVLSFWV